MITDIDAKLLEKIADLTGKPVGAFNIRKDSGCEARQSTEHIEISPRTDGKSGIDIRFKPGTKGEKCYIPVIISKTGVSELVSVCYPHLRAHETDSYLVCRLLLENKKHLANQQE